MQQEKKKVTEVATDLLDHIQYNFIHYVDCLREQKNEALAVVPLNLLTALLSISRGEAQFIPAIVDKDSMLLTRFHFVFSAKQMVKEFLESYLPQLMKSLNTLSSKFTPNDKNILEDSFKRIEENKNILVQPPLGTRTLIQYHKNNIKSDPFLTLGKYKNKKPYFGFSITDFDIPPNNNYQSAYLFPCFQSFCTHYQNERSNVSKFGKLISHSLFSSKFSSPEMYQLIESKKITTFREVLDYVFKHQDHNNRSVQVLKKYYDIDFHIPEILKLLEETTPFPKVVNKIVFEYFTSRL